MNAIVRRRSGTVVIDEGNAVLNENGLDASAPPPPRREPTGVLLVTSAPDGLVVSLDGREVTAEKGSGAFLLGWVGGSPASGALALGGVSVGDHQVSMALSGSPAKTARLTIEATDQSRVPFDVRTGVGAQGTTINTVDYASPPVESRENRDELDDLVKSPAFPFAVAGVMVASAVALYLLTKPRSNPRRRRRSR